MDNFIECPKCGYRVEVSKVEFTEDWVGILIYMAMAFKCPKCGEETVVDVDAYIALDALLND